MATGADPAATADPRAVLTRAAAPPDATVRYGPLPDQVADVRFPCARTGTGTGADTGTGNGAGRSPGVAGARRPTTLVVVVHGGFWRAGYDRRHLDPLAADLAARGYLVAQLEYRRTGQPDGGWPATFDDVTAGMAALPALVADLLGDGATTDRTTTGATDATAIDGTAGHGTAGHGTGVAVVPGAPVLIGHSAGGHLALWYAATHPRRVRGVLALAPVADLTRAYRLDLDGGAVGALLGGGPDEQPARYADADPARLPPPRCPTVIIHGRLDRQVPLELSRRYATAAGSVGADVRLVETSTEHFSLIDPEARIWPTVVAGLQSVFG